MSHNVVTFPKKYCNYGYSKSMLIKESTKMIIYIRKQQIERYFNGKSPTIHSPLENVITFPGQAQKKSQHNIDELRKLFLKRKMELDRIVKEIREIRK